MDDTQECIDCQQAKDRKKDFYWPTGCLRPMKRCKPCHNKQRYKDRVKKHNLGFSGLEDDVKSRIKTLYQDVVEKKNPMTKIVKILQTEFPDHKLTYGKIQQWHKKNQIA